MTGVRIASETYGIRIDVTNPSACAASNPHLAIPSDYDCLFEPDAGFVTPEKSIRLYADKAIGSGAEIITGTKVEYWKDKGRLFEVYTTAGVFFAEKLVITSGPWTTQVLPALSVPLKVTRQVLAWVMPAEPEHVSLGNFPCWMIAVDDLPGCFYGFPMLPSGRFSGPEGFKLAWHYPGKICDPDSVDRTDMKDEEAVLKDFLHRFFPGLYISTNLLKTCLYTNSPDEHFIIDFLPGFEQRVVVAAGFSGHGFKFASAFGEILSEMAIHGKTNMPVGFLGIQRFA
jgi:sarcosine oxidase